MQMAAENILRKFEITDLEVVDVKGIRTQFWSSARACSITFRKFRKKLPSPALFPAIMGNYFVGKNIVEDRTSTTTNNFHTFRAVVRN